LQLPIDKSASQYVLTTDENIYLISQNKKIITDSLENIMKSAAVDCELNYNQNKDGSFKCLTLEGKVGDFLYDEFRPAKIGFFQKIINWIRK
jgi:predicted ATP-grasp superfamily ATP-dependent carboligase